MTTYQQFAKRHYRHDLSFGENAIRTSKLWSKWKAKHSAQRGKGNEVLGDREAARRAREDKAARNLAELAAADANLRALTTALVAAGVAPGALPAPAAAAVASPPPKAGNPPGTGSRPTAPPATATPPKAGSQPNAPPATPNKNPPATAPPASGTPAAVTPPPPQGAWAVKPAQVGATQSQQRPSRNAVPPSRLNYGKLGGNGRSKRKGLNIGRLLRAAGFRSRSEFLRWLKRQNE